MRKLALLSLGVALLVGCNPAPPSGDAPETGGAVKGSEVSGDLKARRDARRGKMGTGAPPGVEVGKPPP
jgi:hypothetical protein